MRIIKFQTRSNAKEVLTLFNPTPTCRCLQAMRRLLLLVFWTTTIAVRPSVGQQRPVGQELSAAAQPGTANDLQQLEELLNQAVSIELRNGSNHHDVKPLRVMLAKGGDKPEKLRVRLKGGGSRSWSLAAIRSITYKGKIVYQNRASDSDKPEKLSKRAQAAQRAAEAHQKWLGRLAARGLEPWPTLSEKEHQAAIEAHKKRYREVAALLPTLQLYETEYFLFCTNIPRQQVGVFIASLDRMYAWMQQTYGIGDGERVWRGKASVFAFVREDEFIAFERQFMKNQPKAGTAGLCHYDRQRNVCIAVNQGTDADYFGVVLVHETSHGFIHCYKTPSRVPSWVNEGMAEVIASLMVPSSKGVERKEKKFLQALQSVPQPRLGKEFFVVNKNIPFDRYGGASSMTRFLLQTDPNNYVRFINLLKEGLPWEEALANSYNATKQQLVASYGRWLGVPNLMP